MRKTFCIILLLTLGLSNIKAQNGEKNFIDKPYIEVTGKAEMEIIPDQIYLNITINEKDNKGKVVLAQAEKEMISKLNSLGIDTKKDLSVKDMSSNFKNYWIKNSQIMTSKEYQLLVTTAQTAGKVMQGLENIGISNVSIERVDHTKIEQFRKEVKVNAVRAAKEKAVEMAQAIGQTAGKALYIRETDNSNYMYLSKASNIKVRGAALMESSDAAVPDIEFEKIKLEYQVSANFELN
jgi:Uncharacterized conserved protein